MDAVIFLSAFQMPRMRNCWRSVAIVAGVALLSGCQNIPQAPPDQAIAGETGSTIKGSYRVVPGKPVTVEFTPGQARPSGSTMLPMAYPLCASLGIDARSGMACDELAILKASYAQKDHEFWYVKILSPGVGKNPADCERPAPIAQYKTLDGAVGLTYLCHAPDTSDVITAKELAALQATALRLNSTRQKTLAEHEEAVKIKGLLSVYGKRRP